MNGSDLMFADLHCHTKISDGTIGISEIMSIAKKLGLAGISITDHDTFEGTTKAQVLGKRYGLKVIPGIEISAIDNKRNRRVHILCYMCAHPSRLQGLLAKTAKSRKDAATLMLQKIMQLYPISPQMVSNRAKGSTNIFKQHIMHTLIDAGYTDKIYSNLYKKLFDPEKGIAYAKVAYPDVFEVVEQIHYAGGVAVLAHPAEYDSFDLLNELIDAKIDGVEVWHSRSTREDEKKLQEIAFNNDLIMTGGSDFHGMYNKKPVQVGSSVAPMEQVNKLIERSKLYNI